MIAEYSLIIAQWMSTNCNRAEIKEGRGRASLSPVVSEAGPTESSKRTVSFKVLPKPSDQHPQSCALWPWSPRPGSNPLSAIDMTVTEVARASAIGGPAQRQLQALSSRVSNSQDRSPKVYGVTLCLIKTVLVFQIL